MEVHRSEAGDVGAVERPFGPVGDAGAVAVLTHVEHIVGVRIERVDGIEGVFDVDVVANPTAACGQSITDLVRLTRVAPTECYAGGPDDGVAKDGRRAAVGWAAFEYHLVAIGKGCFGAGES